MGSLRAHGSMAALLTLVSVSAFLCIALYRPFGEASYRRAMWFVPSGFSQYGIKNHGADTATTADTPLRRHSEHRTEDEDRGEDDERRKEGRRATKVGVQRTATASAAAAAAPPGGDEVWQFGRPPGGDEVWQFGRPWPGSIVRRAAEGDSAELRTEEGTASGSSRSVAKQAKLGIPHTLPFLPFCFATYCFYLFPLRLGCLLED